MESKLAARSGALLPAQTAIAFAARLPTPATAAGFAHEEGSARGNVNGLNLKTK